MSQRGLWQGIDCGKFLANSSSKYLEFQILMAPNVASCSNCQADVFILMMMMTVCVVGVNMDMCMS